MSKAITVSNSRKNDLVNLVQAFSAMGLLSKVEFLDSVLDLSKKTHNKVTRAIHHSSVRAIEQAG